MADVRKTIEILFKGIDETSNTIKDISSGIDSFGSNVHKVTGPLADLAQKALLSETAILGLAGAFIGVAYNATERFESAQLDLQKVMGEGEGNVNDYTDSFLDLSNTYGRLAEEVIQGATNFRLAGFDIKGSIELVEQSTKLLIAGDLDAAQATEILVATLKGFKAPAEEAARIVDILNEVSNNYATNARELGVGMAELSPIARLMGFSFEETAGILTPVIEIFRSGSEAANALKVGLLRLLDDSKPVQDALANLGVAQKDANGHLRSGRDILFDVGEAFKYADANDKLFLASQLVGIRQAGRMIEVFDGMSKATEITGVALGASGSAMKEVTIRLNSIEVAGDRAAVAMNNLLLAVGGKMKEDLTALINSFTTLASAITKSVNDGQFDNLINIFIPIVNEIEELFLSMAGNIKEVMGNVDFSLLARSIENLRGEVIDAFQALFGDIDLGTPEGLEDFIQKIVDGVTSLTNVTAAIIDVWEPFIGLLGDAITKFLEGGEEAAKFAGNLGGISGVVDAVATRVDILSGALNILGAGMGLLGAASLTKTIVENFGKIAVVFQTAYSAAAGLGPAIGALAGAGVVFSGGWAVGTAIRETFPVVDEFTQKIIGAIDSVTNFTGTQGPQQESLEETKKRLAENIQRMQEYKRAQDEASGKIQTEVEVIAKGEDAEIVKGMLNGDIDRETGLPSWAADTTVPWIFEAKVDEDSIKDVQKKVNTDIIQWWDSKGYHEMVVTVDPVKTQDELDKAVPSEKEVLLRIKGDYDIALKKIETDAETIQKAMEFEAKVDIAQIEGQVRIIEAAFDSVNVGIQSTGDVITSILGQWTNADLSIGDKFQLEDYIEREYAFREQQFELQKQLAASETRLNTAKEKFYAGEGGEAIITIETSEVYPELDLVLLEIIKRAQIKANALGLASLLGVTA